jgi:hypothetical protein
VLAAGVQLRLSLIIIKTEIPLHTPHHANNMQYYFQIQAGRVVIVPRLLTVLHPSPTQKSAQNVLVLAAP